MKTASHPGPLARTLRVFGTLLLATALWSLPGRAHAQLYVSGSNVSAYNATTGAALPGFTPTGALSGPVGLALSGNNLFVALNGINTVAEYNATTGASINNSFIAEGGIDGWDTYGLAASGNVLFVANPGVGSSPNGFITAYNATTGAALPGFTGPNSFYGSYWIAVSGNNLYVEQFANAQAGSGSVTEYNATTGAVNSSFSCTGLNSPGGIAVSGNNLFVSAYNGTTVGEYNATTGALMTNTFISGLDDPQSMAVSGNDLYVANSGNNTVGEYNATTGAPIGGWTSPTGLNGPIGLAVAPEPGSTVLLALGAGALLGWRRRNSAAA